MPQKNAACSMAMALNKAKRVSVFSYVAAQHKKKHLFAANLFFCLPSARPVRRMLAIMLFFTFGLTGFSHANGIMNQSSKSLWQIIDALAQQIPFSKQKVEAVLGVQLVKTEHASSSYFDIFKNKQPIHLTEGAAISGVELRIKCGGKDPGLLFLHIDGVCITKDQLKVRYDQLRIIQHPRGESLEETTVYSPDLPWGTLSFAFKERNPDCLARIGFILIRIRNVINNPVPSGDGANETRMGFKMA